MSKRRTRRRKRRLPSGRSIWLVLIAAPLLLAALVVGHNYIKLIQYYVVARPWHTTGVIAGAVRDSAVLTANSALIMLDSHDVPRDAHMPEIHLRIEANSIRKMAGKLPFSAKAKYYRARLKYPDGRWRKIRFRFRGLNMWHFHPEKPSLRLKLRRSAPIDLQRHINLVSPEDRPMVSNMLGERLARELGVLTHETRFARLYINKEYRGVYHWTTREDENLLRLRHRMPGPIFVGDALKSRWQADQFEVGGETAILEQFNPLEQMIDAIYMPPSIERYQALWKTLSFDKYAGWIAAMNLAGSWHTDFIHNHIYYFDPSTGLLEPAISDINGHGMNQFPGTGWDPEPRYSFPINETNQPLLDAALRDPRLYHRRNRILFDAMNGIGSPQSQSRILDEYFSRIDASVRADRNKAAIRRVTVHVYRFPYSNGQFDASKRHLYKWIKKHHAFLKKEMELSKVRISIDDTSRNGRLLLLVEIDGHTAARFDPAVLGNPVFADKAFTGLPGSIVATPMLLYPGLRKEKTNESADWRVPNHRLKPGPQKYLFAVRANPATDTAALKKRLLSAFRHSLTEKPLTPEIETGVRIDPSKIDYNDVSIHAWRFPENPKNEIKLGPGDIQLRENLVVEPGQTLTVAAGTTLRLGPGVSVLSRGVVRFKGKPKRPIVIKRLVANKAWGALVIQGPASAGSSVRHARISGGSLAQAFNVRYSGMLSVHWSNDFVLEDTDLSRNTLSDDTFHVVNSRFEVSRGRFSDCFSDCIDLDYASGRIENLEIQRAGNDGIDFMTSEVKLSDIRVLGAGDKGLSVGEASKVTADGILVEKAKIGVASKDKSQVFLSRSRLRGNAVAIDLAAKNWRYGGPGAIEIRRTEFADNDVDIRAGQGSVATVADQPIPEKIAGDGRIITQIAEQK